MLFGSTARRGLMGTGRAPPIPAFDPRFPTHRANEAFDPSAVPNAMPMPGPISGYGGGAFNMDGSPATPVQRGFDPQDDLPGSMPPVFARQGGGASAFGWDKGGTDTLPALPPPSPQPPSLPTRSGMFGAAAPTPDSTFPAVSAMGERLGSNGFPGRPVGQSFDYEAALASMLPQQKKRSTLEKIASIAAPMLMGMAGNQAGANAFLANQQSRRDADARQRNASLGMVERWKHNDFARQNGADLRASAPRVIGRSMVQYDPNSGSVGELYDGAEDFETYAETQGLEPGTQEYFDAVQDYVLKSDGPTAYERDRGLDDYRTGNRLKLEGARQGNRESLEGIRQNNRVTTRGLPTYRDTHPRAAGGGKARPTATGPNGQKMEYDGTSWVPVR